MTRSYVLVDGSEIAAAHIEGAKVTQLRSGRWQVSVRMVSGHVEHAGTFDSEGDAAAFRSWLFSGDPALFSEETTLTAAVSAANVMIDAQGWTL